MVTVKTSYLEAWAWEGLKKVRCLEVLGRTDLYGFPGAPLYTLFFLKLSFS